MSAEPSSGQSADDSGQDAWTGGKNPWAIALVVTMATFMEMLDTSIANVALPHMAGSLSASQNQSTWVLTAYLVSNAIVMPISGWLATKIGRKRYYMASVFVFTVASLLCGIAPSLGWLVAFRVLQGIGGGGLAPIEQAILLDTFPPSKAGMGSAVYGMSVILAPAIGPTLGGFITDQFSWRWIFLINVPIGLLSLFLTNRLISDPPYLRQARNRPSSIDFVGLALITLGLGCLEVVLATGQEEDWFHSQSVRAFAVVTVCALVSFVIWEWRQKAPVVEVRMFANRSFATANLMMLMFGLTVYGTTLLLPQYVQSVMHWSAQQAGLVLSPGAVTVVILMPIVGTLVARMEPRLLVALGFAVASAAVFYMSYQLYPGIDLYTAAKLRVYQAAGLAFLFVPITTLAYASMPKEKSTAVSGIINLSRNMGGDIGIALVTTMLARRAQEHQSVLVEHVTADNPNYREMLRALAQRLELSGVPMPEALHKAGAIIYGALRTEAVTLSYLDALRVLALGTACMLPLVVLLQPGKQQASTVAH